MMNPAHNGARYPRLSIASTSFELVQYLLDTFGGRYVNSRTKNRAGYQWRLNGKTVVPAFLEKVFPFLRESRKRARAHLLLFEYPCEDMDAFMARWFDGED